MKRIAALVLSSSVLFAPGEAIGGEPAPDEAKDTSALFAAALAALGEERPTDAIAKLESLGDHGVVDPVISYDRGLAYALRVRAGAEQEGDLGRAAHGFEEARELSRDPALRRDARAALEEVRAEVARRRARAGDPVAVEHGMWLGRSIVGLLPENVWAALALVASFVLSLAFVARARAELPRAKVAATTTASIAGGILVLAALLAWEARDLRLHLREGIVVAAKARLLDERHLAKDGVAPIAEGARLRILDEDGSFSHVVVGHEEGWLPSSVVLPIAKPAT